MNSHTDTTPNPSLGRLTSIGARAALTVAVIAAASTATITPCSAQGHGLIRGGLGVDPISGGMAFSGGGGYRAPLSGAIWYEGTADLFYHSGSEDWTEDGYTGTTNTEMTIVAARFNMLFNYNDASRSMYPIVGFGLFAGGGEWSETEQSLSYSDITYSDGGEGRGFGNIFNFGLGFKTGERCDLRVEAPVMVSWGAVANSVSIPFTVSAGVHF
ncbi:MAG: hypothetical protein PVF43_05125 [Candidatus Eiseniibacteriota bacterium]|jgi:hypothetical protein